MKFRVTDARSFAKEFEASTPNQFKAGCSEALMGIADRRFIEVQFQDKDGEWRLPLKQGMAYQFRPAFDADFGEAYHLMLDSMQHLIDLSGLAQSVGHDDD